MIQQQEEHSVETVFKGRFKRKRFPEVPVGDSRSSEERPAITVQSRTPDFDCLVEESTRMASHLWQRYQAGDLQCRCIYINPETIVLCQFATAEFFEQVRKVQGKWCRRMNRVFDRRFLRRVRDWVSADSEAHSSEAKYLERAFVLTGVLSVEGQLIPSWMWPKGQKSTKAKKSPRENVIQEQ